MLPKLWPSAKGGAVQGLVLLLENMKFALERVTTERVFGSYKPRTRSFLAM